MKAEIKRLTFFRISECLSVGAAITFAAKLRAVFFNGCFLSLVRNVLHTCMYLKVRLNTHLKFGVYPAMST